MLGLAVIDRPQEAAVQARDSTRLATLASSASEKPATGSPKSRKSMARLSTSSC